jgi:methylphosphotriester-DNA--protein-cysteine methyltransferase
VKRLVMKGIVVRDTAIDAVLHDERRALSLRSEQRHFQRATGVTRGMVRQIERARYAANLLRQGVSILDVVHLAGYFDQAHLTRSLKYRIGQTPADIARAQHQLSFLYKTTPLL